MNILNSIPPIRYLNLDKDEGRRFYIEKQFEKYGITNFTRISADRYGVDNYKEWTFEGELNENYRLSTLLNQCQSIVDWYDENISETCIIAEDDINLDLCKYWGFDWKYFEYHLPCNWDCVQLHVVGERYIPMGLSLRTKTMHSAACYLINRTFAAKLKRMFYRDGKFKFPINYGYHLKKWDWYHYQSADFVPYNVGITYSFPLFITNSRFKSNNLGEVNQMVVNSDKLVANWWVNKSKNYEPMSLFCYTDKCQSLIQYLLSDT
jgi:hypothetical protein